MTTTCGVLIALALVFGLPTLLVITACMRSSQISQISGFDDWYPHE